MNVEFCQKIQKTLQDEGIYSYVYQREDYPSCVYLVTIELGDWKHEHARARYILGERFGAEQIGENAIENGTDTYTSTHVMIIKQ